MSSHHWVKIQITPVHVVADPDVSNEPVVYSSEDDEIEAAESVQYGCLKCDEPLTSQSLNSPCEVTTAEWIDKASQEE